MIENIPARVQDKFILRRFSIDEVAISLARNVEVISIGGGSAQTHISLEILYSGSDPVAAKDIVNAIAVSYLKRSVEESTQNLTQILQFIDHQMSTIADRVKANLSEVENYKKGSGLQFLEQVARIKINNISELEGIKDRDRNQITTMENLIDILQSAGAISDQDLMIVENLPNPIIGSLVTTISNLKIERETLAQKYTEEHPDMKENQVRIDHEMSRVVDALRSRINFLKNEIEMADDAIKRYSGELDTMSESRRNMTRMLQVGSINQRMLSFLIQRNEETKIARAGIVPDVQIVVPASSAKLI